MSIYVQKPPKQALGFYAGGPEDVPQWLIDNGTITINPDGKSMTMVNSEGKSNVFPFNSVVLFEESKEKDGTWCAWVPDQSRVRVNEQGDVYLVPKPTEVTLFEKDIPDFLRDFGDKFERLDDGSVVFHAPWGDSVGQPYKCFFALYDIDKMDAGIVTVGTQSCKDYKLCTPDGQDILREDGQPWTLQDLYKASQSLGISWDKVEEMYWGDVAELTRSNEHVQGNDSQGLGALEQEQDGPSLE